MKYPDIRFQIALGAMLVLSSPTHADNVDIDKKVAFDMLTNFDNRSITSTLNEEFIQQHHRIYEMAHSNRVITDELYQMRVRYENILEEILRTGKDPAQLSEIGKPAPALDVIEWKNSKPLALEDLRGKKVVLNFWGMWCPPCIKNIPEIQKIAEHHPEIMIINIHSVEHSHRLPEFIESYDFKLPIAVDNAKMAGFTYGVRTFPRYYLIDEQGILIETSKSIADIQKLL